MRTWVVFVILIVLALSVWLHESYNRYTIVAAGEPSLAYKLDRFTGEVSAIMGKTEVAVQSK